MKHTGVNIPLFSLRSTRSWGIGEIPDLVPFATWLSAAGFDRLMLLPLGTMRPGESSPYSASSTVAIDPIFIGIEAVPDFAAAGGVDALSTEARQAIAFARASEVVLYDAVRRGKDEALGLAFDHFVRHEWEQLTPRAGLLAGYITQQRWWLDDYALFQAIAASRSFAGWQEWPPALRDREPKAIADLRRQFARDALRHQYFQWVAETQWEAARESARACDVKLVGDLPFVAAMDSAEVWARASDYRLDVSIGTPPDAFSAEGQDWGLPLYRWDEMARDDFVWWRLRGRRMAALYDGLRVDHTIGLYRTYGRPRDGEPFFVPSDEPDQIAQGEAVLRVLADSGLHLIAEDLGLVPDFLRVSLAALGIPGCKVLRWEREHNVEGAPFIPPETFAPLSAAMTGTHDTTPLSVWWDEECTPEDQAAMCALPLFQERMQQAGSNSATAGFSEQWSPVLRDLLLELAFRSGSNDLFLPIQDLFGWRDRINVPGTVGPHNWTWTLPWEVDRLGDIPEAQARQEFLRALQR